MTSDRQQLWPYVFDLDGTLVDTEGIGLAAYRDTGVEPPADWFGRHWREWLPDAVPAGANADDWHARKVRRAMQRIRDVDELPAAELVRRLIYARKPVGIITASNAALASALLEHVGLTRAYVLGTETPPNARPGILRTVSTRGTYYDDRRETLRLVQERLAGWKTVLVGPSSTLQKLEASVER